MSLMSLNESEKGGYKEIAFGLEAMKFLVR